MKALSNIAKKINRVKIVEVGARDGLQNEKVLSVNQRVKFINKLTECGFQQIEAGSIVKLKSMSNSDQVFRTINKRNNIEYPLLVLNNKGAEIAGELKAKYISLGVSPSNEFCKKNMGKNLELVVDEVKKIMNTANKFNMQVRGYISTIAVCPYEGEIDPERVSDLTELLLEMGCYEVSLGDTIGKADNQKMENLLSNLKDRNIPMNKLAGHYHDTFDYALDNVRLSLEYGISTFDSSIAGLGGCPFAPGASGNLGTQKLVKFLEDHQIKTNLNNSKINETSDYICDLLERDKYEILI